MEMERRKECSEAGRCTARNEVADGGSGWGNLGKGGRSHLRRGSQRNGLQEEEALKTGI